MVPCSALDTAAYARCAVLAGRWHIVPCSAQDKVGKACSAAAVGQSCMPPCLARMVESIDFVHRCIAAPVAVAHAEQCRSFARS